MKNIFPLLLIVTITLGFISCERFTEGVIHEVPFPEHTPRLAATVISTDTDTKLMAQVTSTASVLDPAGPHPVAGAVISLSIGQDSIVYTLGEENFNDTLYILDLGGKFGHFDGMMTLNVEAPDFESITATNVMPSIPEVELLYGYQADTMTSPWFGEVIRDSYTLDLINHLEIDDTYLIHVDALYIDSYTLDTLDWKNVRLMTQPDHRIVEGTIAGGLMITDINTPDLIDGLTGITFFSESFDDQMKWSPVAMRMRVEALSPELAKFYQSTDNYLSGGFDLFAEPSLIYSNVSSGFGCFGLSSQTMVEIN